MKKNSDHIKLLEYYLTTIISETNAITISDTLELLLLSTEIKNKPQIEKTFNEFKTLLGAFSQDEVDIDTLLGHPVSLALGNILKKFPLKFYEEHIHLTGSLSAEFIYPRLKKLLKGKNKNIFEKKIIEVYGQDALPIDSQSKVDSLIRLKEGEHFKTYLRILYLAKLVLRTKKDHSDAAFHMASELYHKYNVGCIRLKFTLSRETSDSKEMIPGEKLATEEDVVMGLYQGFQKFKKSNPDFDFILSPSFRKEHNFFDNKKFKSKEDHFIDQVDKILQLREKFPELKKHLTEVDTVGDEKELYRKKHFMELKQGLRKLQYSGLRIRSHHGETWKNLRRGVQSVDNAMNIWQIDTLEHGLSLGINPNYYFHRLFQNVMQQNSQGLTINQETREYSELEDMPWVENEGKNVLSKLIKGKKLSEDEVNIFIKTKFHAARELEHYQHDVLNRMINKKVSLVALPSSNMKLTECFPDYKDHPFSWWEKKGVKLGVGTDNYITLSTDYIKELLILLYSDSENLKITKLLMVATRETRRPYISSLLWQMRKQVIESIKGLNESQVN